MMPTLMRPGALIGLTAGALLAAAVAGASPREMCSPSSAIYVNGRVWTGDSTDRFVQAIAVARERIVTTGGNEEIRALACRKTRVVDLAGKLVTPGFIDAHTHFIDAALALDSVRLRDAATPEEFARRIGERALQRPTDWITNGMWDHELWGSTLPERGWIDALTADTPVFVIRLDGHMGLANSRALQLAGIDASTPNPAGGEIVRDAAGRPTGLLKDTAMDLVQRVIPPATMQALDTALVKGIDEALSRGVTQIHDMGGDGTWRSFETFRRARAAGTLRLRVYSFVPLGDWARMAQFVREHGRGDEWLRWGGLKGYVDGSLGSTTAWFDEPYTDEPTTRGYPVVDLEELAQQIRQADRAGLHLAVHAIGDRANDWLLDTYERIARENGPSDRRFRVEHAQHLSRAAIPRFAKNSVIASMQPYHAIDDGRWAQGRIGEARLSGAFAFRSLLAAEARVIFGSDWPVAPIDPLTGIAAAVARQTLDGRHPGGWQPQERIDVAAALRAYTASAAYAGFQEAVVGRIAPGFLADFVVLSHDLFAAEGSSMTQVRVLRTVIAGEDRFVDPTLSDATR